MDAPFLVQTTQKMHCQELKSTEHAHRKTAPFDTFNPQPE